MGQNRDLRNKCYYMHASMKLICDKENIINKMIGVFIKFS